MAGPKINCPRCEKEIVWSEAYPFRPFCSERCKMIDLGSWMDEEHAIAGQTIDPDDIQKFIEE